MAVADWVDAMVRDSEQAGDEHEGLLNRDLGDVMSQTMGTRSHGHRWIVEWSRGPTDHPHP